MEEATERVGRVRKGRKDGGFTVVRNDLINHPTLPVEARALMIYLLSRPEDWELRITDVRRFLGKGGKPCGRDKAYSVVRELRDARYLVMCEDVSGQHFAGVTYYVFEEPVKDAAEVQRRHRAGEDALAADAKTPLPENQETGDFSRADFPHPENTEQTKERYIQNTNPPSPPKQRKTRRRNGSGEAVAAPPSTTRIAEPWSPQWVEHRVGLLKRGWEQAPAKTSRFVAELIAKGGPSGERERLALQARSCWPTINLMDDATLDGRGWRVSVDLFDCDLASQYRSVRVDSEEFAEWQEAHRLRGWPELPRPLRAACVWLPACGLAALELANEAPAMAASR